VLFRFPSFNPSRSTLPLTRHAHFLSPDIIPQRPAYDALHRPTRFLHSLPVNVSACLRPCVPRSRPSRPTARLAACLILACFSPARAELRIPANTAYSQPDADAVRISARGVREWKDPIQSLNWYGQFKSTGTVTARLVIRPAPDTDSRLRATLDATSRTITIPSGTETATVDLGEFNVTRVGYHSFSLLGTNAPGHANGEPIELILDGPASEGAHFNLKDRRNAASIHLRYDPPKDVQVAAFYSEVTGITDPTTTFYMACGWHRGYFGMQVNSPTERRIIFSVWDSGNEGVDRNKVAAADRVQLIGKGEGVYSGDFGNEGTGGHSHLKYLWKTGEPQRFLVTAAPDDATHTTFAGYYFHPDRKEWMLISAWRAPKEGGYLRGMHGFSENFWGNNGHLLRKSLHGNQWMKTDDGRWLELTRAVFSHDPTGRNDRLDRFMGVENGQFFLSHGGFIDGFTPGGGVFHRPPTGRLPSDLQLPPITGVQPKP
jgi:hypothetical protein